MFFVSFEKSSIQIRNIKSSLFTLLNFVQSSGLSDDTMIWANKYTKKNFSISSGILRGF
jgi:hypothetical protein